MSAGAASDFGSLADILGAIQALDLVPDVDRLLYPIESALGKMLEESLISGCELTETVLDVLPVGELTKWEKGLLPSVWVRFHQDQAVRGRFSLSFRISPGLETCHDF